MTSVLVPPRRRGYEILDQPGVDPAIVRRSLRDVARSNYLFGGTRAVLSELRRALPDLPREATLLDVGTGVGDIPARARQLCRDNGVTLSTFGLDNAEELAAASARRHDATLCADALEIPLADRSVDVVMCSQVLHHFAGDDAARLLAEMNRVARTRVIVSDIRRSWLAAAGLWLASFPLMFHPISRHDGVVSVLRGYTVAELGETIRAAIGVSPGVTRRFGFRVTTSWSPT